MSVLAEIIAILLTIDAFILQIIHQAKYRILYDVWIIVVNKPKGKWLIMLLEIIANTTGCYIAEFAAAKSSRNTAKSSLLVVSHARGWVSVLRQCVSSEPITSKRLNNFVFLTMCAYSQGLLIDNAWQKNAHGSRTIMVCLTYTLALWIRSFPIVWYMVHKRQLRGHNLWIRQPWSNDVYS